MTRNMKNSSEENIDFYEFLAYVIQRPLRINIRILRCSWLFISILLLLFLSENVLSIEGIALCVGFIILVYLVRQTLKRVFYRRIYTVENFEKDYRLAIEYLKNSNKNIPKEYYSSAGYQMIRQFLIEKEQTYLDSWLYISGIKYDLKKEKRPELKLPFKEDKQIVIRYMPIGLYDYNLDYEYPKPLLLMIFTGGNLLFISVIRIFVILWKIYF